MTKILEIITEPNRIQVGSTFKLKVNIVEESTDSEIKELTVESLKRYKIKKLK